MLHSPHVSWRILVQKPVTSGSVETETTSSVSMELMDVLLSGVRFVRGGTMEPRLRIRYAQLTGPPDRASGRQDFLSETDFLF